MTRDSFRRRAAAWGLAGLLVLAVAGGERSELPEEACRVVDHRAEYRRRRGRDFVNDPAWPGDWTVAGVHTVSDHLAPYLFFTLQRTAEPPNPDFTLSLPLKARVDWTLDTGRAGTGELDLIRYSAPPDGSAPEHYEIHPYIPMLGRERPADRVTRLAVAFDETTVEDWNEIPLVIDPAALPPPSPGAPARQCADEPVPLTPDGAVSLLSIQRNPATAPGGWSDTAVTLFVADELFVAGHRPLAARWTDAPDPAALPPRADATYDYSPAGVKLTVLNFRRGDAPANPANAEGPWRIVLRLPKTACIRPVSLALDNVPFPRADTPNRRPAPAPVPAPDAAGKPPPLQPTDQETMADGRMALLEIFERLAKIKSIDGVATTRWLGGDDHYGRPLPGEVHRRLLFRKRYSGIPYDNPLVYTSSLATNYPADPYAGEMLYTSHDGTSPGILSHYLPGDRRLRILHNYGPPDTPWDDWLLEIDFADALYRLNGEADALADTRAQLAGRILEVVERDYAGRPCLAVRLKDSRNPGHPRRLYIDAEQAAILGVEGVKRGYDPHAPAEDGFFTARYEYEKIDGVPLPVRQFRHGADGALQQERVWESLRLNHPFRPEDFALHPDPDAVGVETIKFRADNRIGRLGGDDPDDETVLTWRIGRRVPEALHLLADWWDEQPADFRAAFAPPAVPAVVLIDDALAAEASAALAAGAFLGEAPEDRYPGALALFAALAYEPLCQTPPADDHERDAAPAMRRRIRVNSATWLRYLLWTAEASLDDPRRDADIHNLINGTLGALALARHVAHGEDGDNPDDARRGMALESAALDAIARFLPCADRKINDHMNSLNFVARAVRFGLRANAASSPIPADVPAADAAWTPVRREATQLAAKRMLLEYALRLTEDPAFGTPAGILRETVDGGYRLRDPAADAALRIGSPVTNTHATVEVF